jgi:hypothetical protein
MPIPRRTLREVKTLSGRVDKIANAYMAYMQITCLEMEKARKGCEKASAADRVQTIDNRLRQIEVEKAALLCALAERGKAGPAEGAAPLGHLPAGSRQGARGFKLRY